MIALLGAGLVGCREPAPKPKLLGTSHLPLRENRIWTYREKRDGREEKYSLAVRFLGGDRYQVFRAVVKGIDLGEIAFVQVDSIVYFETTKPLTQLESPLRVPVFRQVWVDENAARGDSWDDTDTGTRTLYAGLDSVTVPAGHYSNCYKTITESLPELADTLALRYARGEISAEELSRQTANSKLVVVRWFAPDIGLVKEQIGHSDFVRELLAVKD